VLSEHNDFKKLEKMISIFKTAIYPKHTDWKLTLVVTYFEEDIKIIDKWKKDAEGFPIEIITNVEHEKLKMIYGKAKIYWHAAGFGEDLAKHPERAEHFGIAPVEAMSAGAVPVVINAGGIPEIVTEGKDGLVWTTEGELVASTEKLIGNEAYRELLSKQAIKKAELFSEKSFAKKLFSIIDSIS
jgi:glycosyltransferase involved in cell wall biosynthesis